jgi:hypothetical protein
MQIGSGYSGMDAVDMVSRSVQMVNDLNKEIVSESIDLDKKLTAVAVEQKVARPGENGSIVDRLA